ALFLSLELAGAVVARQGELPAPAGDGQAVADFADDRLAVHAVAVAEGVAVEGDVARHDAHVAGGEKVPRPSRQARARGRGVLAGRAQRRAAEVVRQAPAPAHFHAGVGVGGAVAEGAAPVRDRIPAPAAGI